MARTMKRRTVDYPVQLDEQLEQAAEEDGFPSFAELARSIARDFVRDRKPAAAQTPTVATDA